MMERARPRFSGIPRPNLTKANPGTETSVTTPLAELPRISNIIVALGANLPFFSDIQIIKKCFAQIACRVTQELFLFIVTDLFLSLSICFRAMSTLIPAG
jgi:hypothetical protein